ncbi:MAG: DUF5723 family protein, partial [Prevotellaceae bacterium]|nr:DUF5723 family protein [Prevotellaceae bacterium]
MIYGKEAVFPCVESHRIAKCATVVTLTLTALVQPYMGAQAQHNATMYFMHDLPTVNLLNPAFQPEEGNLYIGLPMLSSAYVDGGITLRGIRVGDVRDNKVRLRQTAENASFRESAYANVDINVLNIGTYIGRTYFTLDVAAKGRAEAGLPGDLVKMLWRGNYPYRGKAVSASNTGGYGSAYMEFALGFSREVVPNK